MNQKEDLIIFGLQPWDTNLGSNAKNMALELSKLHRVLYINRPLDRSSYFKKRKTEVVQNRLDVIRGKKEAIEQVAPNLWVYTPPIILESIQWLPSYRLFQIFNYWNNRKLAKSIKKAIKALAFKDYVMMNDSSMFMGFYLKEMLKPKHYVYYIRDYLISQNYFKKHGPWAEAALIKKADQVVSNSKYLKQYAEQHRSKASYIGQGCDLDAFDPNQLYQMPFCFPSLEGPVIGYVGLLTARRLDLHLLEELAIKRPDWNFVFVGPEDEAFQNSRLHQCSNAHFLGLQPMEQLPAFIRYFDVCMNPQLQNEMCMGNYPRKIDEYLAMGKSVVATLTPTMEYFTPYVYLAEGVEEYIYKIEKALSEDPELLKSGRVAFAQSHSWENSISAFWNAIETTT